MAELSISSKLLIERERVTRRLVKINELLDALASDPTLEHKLEILGDALLDA